MTPPKQRILLSHTLEQLSKHLDLLSEQIFHVEEALGKELATKDASHSVSITKFQSLDFARQSLEDAALLLNALGKDPNAKIQLMQRPDTTVELKLESTRRLMDQTYEVLPTSDTGDLDLF